MPEQAAVSTPTPTDSNKTA